MKEVALTCALWLAASLCTFVRVAVGQTGGTLSIRVESELVVVPAWVFDKDVRAELVTSNEICCDRTNWEAFDKLRPSQPYLPKDCDERVIRGLTAKDFHVFQDGAEQRIQSVTYEPEPRVYFVRDNVGHHDEYSDTPGAKWSTSELGAGFFPSYAHYLYRIAYVPPKSEVGSRHRIKVKVDRRALVYARDEYYNTKHVPSDPLNGTELGDQLQKDLASAKDGKIGLSLQTSFFYTDTDAARADIAIEFPWSSLHREWRNGTLQATIGVLGVVYRKDETLAGRFSGIGCCPPEDYPTFVRTDNPYDDPYKPRPWLDVSSIPSRYETQIELPPGQYDLRVVLSDSWKYGRVEVPLIIDSYDREQLALSSVVLGKRYCDAGAAAQEAAAANLAPQYVPLVSKGIQVTPAGDTHFTKAEPLIAYFEAYEPQVDGKAEATVQAHLRIRDAETGEIRKEFPPLSAAPYIKAGSRAIPIEQQIDIGGAPKGAYRLEVQATDSAGRSTAWRTANFTVEQ